MSRESDAPIESLSREELLREVNHLRGIVDGMRKTAEQALQASEARFRSTFETAAVGIAHLKPTGEWLRLNNAFCEMLGYSEEEMRSLTVADVTHPEDLENDWSSARRLLDGEIPHYALEKRYVRKDGSIFWGDLVRSLVRDSAGCPEYFVVVVREVTARKAAEEALRESEAFTNRVLDNLFAFVGVMDLDGTLLSANRAPLEAAGIRLEDVVGKKFWDCYWWSYSPSVQADLRAAFEQALTGAVVRYDVPVRMADELLMWIDFQLAPLRDSDGNVTHLIPSAMDLTARKAAEQAMEESEARARAAAAEANAERRLLSAVLDALPVGVIISATDGKILRDNAANRELWGVPPDTASWEAYGEWVGFWPETGQRIQAHEWAMARALLNGDTVRGELVQNERFGTGERRYYLNNAAPVRDEDGQIVAGVVAEQDVTDRLRLERSVREGEARFRALVDNIDQLAWMAEADGNIFWYNRRWYEYTGTRPEDMEGWGWQSVHDPEVLPKVLKEWKASIDSGRPFDMEFPLRGADGVFRPFLTRIHPIVDDEGRVSMWFGTNTDVSAQKEIEAELEQRVAERTAELQAAHDALESFTHHVAHDLRSPLRSIVSTSAMIQMDHGDVMPGEALEMLRRQSAAAKRMALLIDDLLEMARLSRAEAHRAETDVTTLAREAAAEARVSHPQSTAEIRVEEGLRADADPRLLKLVVANLVENAVKYSPEGGVVRVGRREDGAFFVSDQGIGIVADYHQKVFEPFQRLHSESQFRGTGIGLSNVRQIVALHGGTVWVESEPGKGSTFWFTLG